MLVLIAAGLFIFFEWRSGIPAVSQNTTSAGLPPLGQLATSTQSNPASISQATLFLGDATISGADISSTMPSDAPQSPTIPFQTASGTVSLKNFYLGAQGYWFDLDSLLLQYDQAYVLWYYRGISEFVIVLPENGEDQAAAEAALAGDLGVSQQTLCSLPVMVEYVFDRGNSEEDLPLESCPQQTF